ncbi:MAG: HlyD family secretion protein [Terrimicrobiaceae bacterium]|nr:HlyD family secretion protein [Terrimicrobiaceae bacterium]
MSTSPNLAENFSVSGPPDVLPPAGPARPGRKPLIAGLLAIAIVGGLAVYVANRGKISTDDAFIEAHIISISPQISERVNRVLVSDNQLVKRGDLLVELDPLNEQVILETARANLASCEAKLVQARAQLAATDADLSEKRADISQAQASADNATKELARSVQLRQSGAIAQREYDNAQAQALSTKAALDSKQQVAFSAESAVKVAAAQVNAADAQVAQAKALLDAARLRLSYTRIEAPETGRVTRKSVEPGSYVQTGAALLAIVPPEVWVVANFKETQLDKVRPGQPVDIKVDAYPSLKFHGRVDSIQSGTGSRFSLLPAENATGNYVKVVQRVPLKIVLDALPKDAPLLSPGMSVVPTIHVSAK